MLTDKELKNTLPQIRRTNSQFAASGIMSLTSPSNRYGNQSSRLPNGSGVHDSQQLNSDVDFKNLLNDKNQTSKVSIISATDLEKIYSNAKLNYNPEADLKRKQKEELRLISETKAKKWSNTIIGNLNKKNQDRFDKFWKEEQFKRDQDDQEVIIQELKKRDLIKEANQKIFDTNDKVKAFKSALLQSEVLVERENQMKVAESKKDMYKTMDASHDVVLIQAEQVLIRNELEKKQRQLKKEQSNQKELVKQQKEKLETILHDIRTDRREGEMLKFHAELEVEENKEKKVAIRKKRTNLIEEMKENHQYKQRLDAQKLSMEQDQEKRDQEHKEIKAGLELRRKKIEVERQFEHQLTVQHLSDKQKKQMESLKDCDHLILGKQEAEIEEKFQQKIKQKKKYDLELRKAIDENNAASISIRADQKELDRILDKRFQEHYIQKNLDIAAAEIQEKNFNKQREVDCNNFQKMQIADKASKRYQKYIQDLKDDDIARNSLALDRKIFGSYAESCIEEYKNNGKDILPLLLKLDKLKKVA